MGPCARNWHKNMQAWKDLALSMRISLIFLIVLLLVFLWALCCERKMETILCCFAAVRKSVGLCKEEGDLDEHTS